MAFQPYIRPRKVNRARDLNFCMNSYKNRLRIFARNHLASFSYFPTFDAYNDFCLKPSTLTVQ